MKTLFDPAIMESLKQRIIELKIDANPIWGKMNCYQMLKHCSESIKIILGEKTVKRPLLSFFLGKIVKWKIVKDAGHLPKLAPTLPELEIKDTGDAQKQKQELLSLLSKYESRGKSTFEGVVHPFYGKVTADEIGMIDFKHLDHHLRQFGV